MAKKLRYGFKTEAEYYSGLFRKELGIEPHGPLCPRALAEHLEVPVRDLSSHPSVPDDVKEFWRRVDRGGFSAVTIADGTYREIVHNDFHHQRRQNTDIAHELAHIILGHSLSAPIGENGERIYDPEVEEEAKWLGFALLLPKEATFYIVLNEIPLNLVQYDYGVSQVLLEYRIRVTDAHRRAKNFRRKHGLLTH